MRRRQTNRFDPDRDEVMRLVARSGLTFQEIVRRADGEVGIATLYNWHNGTTCYPQHGKMRAVLSAIGYVFVIEAKSARKHIRSVA